MDIGEQQDEVIVELPFEEVIETPLEAPLETPVEPEPEFVPMP